MAADNDLISLFMSFGRSVRHSLNGTLPDACSFMHVKTLEYVKGKGSPSMSEIAEELKITSPGATIVVDKLVELGDLERVTDADDRRVVRLRITPRGKKTLDAGSKEIHRKMAERLSVLSKSEHDQLRSVLEKLMV